jgi:hypothetical protein
VGFPVCHTVGLRRTDAEIIQLGGLRALRARCKCPGAGHFALAEVCLGAEQPGHPIRAVSCEASGAEPRFELIAGGRRPRRNSTRAWARASWEP